MQVQCSNDVYTTFKPVMARKKFEHFMIALLDNKNRIVRKMLVGMGTTNECQVEPFAGFSLRNQTRAAENYFGAQSSVERYRTESARHRPDTAID